MMRTHRSRSHAGFSLVEVLAALFVFTLLTLGLVPLLTSSIRGSNTARADTVGKNAALKAMERVRGLPYYVSYATSTDRVDVLDLYYPNGADDEVIDGRTVFQIECSADEPADPPEPACPRQLPAGYTITFEAQFVDPVASGAQPTVGETATSYTNIAPADTYQWDSLSNDEPPRQILQMSVTATWTVGGSDETYTITSLLTDRSFGGRKLKATATVGYGADIYTEYDSNQGGGEKLSSGNVFVATGESDIEGRRLSTARQTATALRGELQREAGGSLGTVTGATSNVLQAPPDQQPGTISASGGTLRHSEFGNAAIAEFGDSSVITPAALSASASPSAVGDTEMTGNVSGQPHYVAIRDPQLNAGDLNALQLSTNAPLLNLSVSNGLPGPLPGITAPITTGDAIVGGTRTSTLADSVHAQATIGFDRIYLFRGNWPELSDTEAVAEGGSLTGLRHLIVIEDLQASVTCDSDTNGTGSGAAQYSGTLYYWEDPTPNTVRTDGRYRRVSLSASGSDPLADIMDNPPLVYDHNSANLRTYLFPFANRGHYLTSWTSLTETTPRVDSSTDATGATVSTVNASIDGAIEIETADIDADKKNVGFFTISLASLSCFAEDAR